MKNILLCCYAIFLYPYSSLSILCFLTLIPLTLQMIPPLLALSQNRSKLKLYIAHLTDLCHDRDPSILSQLTPPSHYHHSDPDDWEDELQKMTVQQVPKEPLVLHCLFYLCTIRIYLFGYSSPYHNCFTKNVWFKVFI